MFFTPTPDYTDYYYVVVWTWTMITPTDTALKLDDGVSDRGAVCGTRMCAT